MKVVLKSQLTIAMICLIIVNAQTIYEQKIDNLQDSLQIKVVIPTEFIGKQIFIEVNSIPNDQIRTQKSSFLLLVGQPGVKLPEYYSLLFAFLNLQNILPPGAYVDMEGYGSSSWYQFVQILSLTPSQAGEWKIGLYEFITNNVQKRLLLVRVFALTQTDKYCPQACNQQSENPNVNSCNKSLQEMDRFCNCGENYIGRTCSLKVQQIDLNTPFQVAAIPMKWSVYSFKISENSPKNLSLFLTGYISKMMISFIYGIQSSLSFPNMMNDNQEIIQQSLSWQEYPVISEKLSNMLAQNTLINADLNHPLRDKRYDYMFLVGFYNLDVSSVVQLSCKLQTVNDQAQTMLNKTTIILSITFGCVIFFCVTPLTYLCLKRRRQRQLQIIKTLFQNNINQQNQNPIPIELPQQEVPPSVEDQVIVLNNPIASITDQIMHVQTLKIIKKVVPITKDTINKFMPTQQHKDVIRLYPSLTKEGEECTVCLEGFEESSKCRITPCFHIFHSECLESWFQKHSTCPYCRNQCNRKGIISLLQQGKSTSYAKRIQEQGILNNNQDVCISDPNCEQKPTQIRSNFICLENQQIFAQNFNEQAEQIPIKLDISLNNQGDKLNVITSKKRSSIAETLLNQLKKPVSSFFRESNASRPSTNQVNTYHYQNENVNRNTSSNAVNHQGSHMSSQNCLSQNQLVEQHGQHMLSFNLPPKQNMNQNDILLSLDNNPNKEQTNLDQADMRQKDPISQDISIQLFSTRRQMCDRQKEEGLSPCEENIDQDDIDQARQSYEYPESMRNHINNFELSSDRNILKFVPYSQDSSVTPTALVHPQKKLFQLTLQDSSLKDNVVNQEDRFLQIINQMKQEEEEKKPIGQDVSSTQEKRRYIDEEGSQEVEFYTKPNCIASSSLKSQSSYSNQNPYFPQIKENEEDNSSLQYKINKFQVINKLIVLEDDSNSDEEKN